MKKTIIIYFIFVSFLTFNAMANEDPSKEKTIAYIAKLIKYDSDIPFKFTIDEDGIVTLFYSKDYYTNKYSMNEVKFSLSPPEESVAYVSVLCNDYQACHHETWKNGNAMNGFGLRHKMTSKKSAEQLFKALNYLQTFDSKSFERDLF